MTATVDRPKRSEAASVAEAELPVDFFEAAEPEAQGEPIGPEIAESPGKPQSLQLIALALYNREGVRRELRFHLGQVNVITGASLTGKSTLIKIVDYCLGRGDFEISAGRVAETVVWYVLHVHLPNGEALIGRLTPPAGSQSTNAAYLEVGTGLSLPEYASLRVNSNAEAVSNFLTEQIGITANENIPDEGQSRRALTANIGHARFLLFQPQTIIANDKHLFYRSDDTFIAQSIKDTLPYFLGASGDDQFDMRQRLRQMKREYRLLERRVLDEAALRGRENSRALSLVAEAENSGLIARDERPVDLAVAIELLRRAVEWTLAEDTSPQGNALAALQAEKERLYGELRSTQSELDSARSFAAAQDDFKTEASDQKNRLSSIELYKADSDGKCPLCEQSVDGIVPTIDAIRGSLVNLERQISGTTRQRPRLESYFGVREERLVDLRRQLRENRASIEGLMAQEEALARNRDRMVAQARVVGRISLFLESVRLVEDDDGIAAKMEDLQSQIVDLEANLSDELVEDRLNSVLHVVGRDMSEWAKRLELEHSEWPIGLDLNSRNPTVIAYRGTGPIRMFQMGGGKNWMGYHVITHLALQKLFQSRRRPVPGLLMLDQPTQVFYPPDPVPDHSVSELVDEDREAVRRLFKLIFDVVDLLSPNLQVIITDHADLPGKQFQDAVLQKWRGKQKLIPISWYETGPTEASDTNSLPL